MTQPEYERQRLLLLLQKEDQPVLSTYAEHYIFPDITIAEWCMQHEVKVRTIVRDGSHHTADGVFHPSAKVLRHDGKPNRYVFYIFSLIQDEEW